MRLAIRELFHFPLYAAFVVLSIATGVGTSFTVWGLIRATLTAEPDLPSPERLFHVYGWDQRRLEYLQISFPDFHDFQTSLGKRADLAAFFRTPADMAIHGERLRLSGELVSANYFRVLRAAPVLGTFFADSDAAGREPRIVIAESLWRSHFGGSSRIVGQQITVNGIDSVICGVAPSSFGGTVLDWSETPQIWMMVENPPGFAWLRDVARNRAARMFVLVGRRHSAALSGFPENAVTATAARLAAEFPEDRQTSAAAMRVRDSRFWPSKRPLVRRSVFVLMAGALLLLAMGVFNAANLIWVQCLNRTRQFAIRLALGESSGAIFRSIWLQCLFLTLPGLAVGLFMNKAANYAIGTIGAPFGFPLTIRISIDWYFVLSGACAVVAIAAMIAVWPAWDTARTNPAILSHASDSDPTSGRARVRTALVALQSAISMVIVSAAVLAATNLNQIAGSPLGFDPAGLLLVRIGTPQDAGLGPSARQSLITLPSSVSTLPGVSSATLCRLPPLDSSHIDVYAGREPTNSSRSELFHKTGLNLIGPGYFRTLGVPLLKGREFNGDDLKNQSKVVVINAILARALFGSGDPTNQTIQFRSSDPRRQPTSYRIIGVAPQMKYSSLSTVNEPFLYAPLTAAQTSDGASLVVRGNVDERTLHSALNKLKAFQDSGNIVLKILPLSRQRDSLLTPEHTLSVLATSFGFAAALVGVAGMFSWAARFTVEHFRSLGVRLALGAPRFIVASGVLRAVLLTAGAGVLLGSVLLCALRLQLAEVFPGSASYFRVISIIAASHLLLALLVAAVPAFHASRIDPLRLVRHG